MIEKGLVNVQQFQEKYQEIVMVLQSVFQRTRFSKKLPLQPVKDVLDRVELLAGAVGVLNQLKKVPNRKEEYPFRHAVNVSVVAGLLGLEAAVRKELLLAGLLHDIGKMKVPIDVLDKPGSLNPYEMQVMKKHVLFSYQLLQPYPEVSPSVKLWILQHHERLDGSGYPYAFDGDKLSYQAQILAVADTYDAMTSSRVYRNADTPFSVIDELSQEMFGKLDPGICTVFLKKLSESLIGNPVTLNNGEEAKIIRMDTRPGLKPLVKTAEGDCIDLETSKELEIVKVRPI
jgi:HD-GYP domain-containing protein (c-di-GMP phosphodiesterase class II)